MSDNQSVSGGILTTPVIYQVIEFLNEESVRRQDEPGVEVINQWIEELPKLLAENANLKRDKERLDWWLEHKFWLRAPGDYGGLKAKWRVYSDDQIVAAGDSPGEAIDAAMQGKSAALDSREES